MKVLLSVDCFKNQINGVNTSVKILQKELKSNGIDVRLLALSDTDKSEIINNDYYISSFSVSKIYPGARVSLTCNKKIEREIEVWHPDIIHTQTEFSTYYLAKKVSKKLKIPMVHTLHTMYEDYHEYVCKNEKISKEIIKKILKRFLKNYKYLIVPSEKVKNSIINNNIYNNNINIIPTGIDLNQFKQKISNEEKVYLFDKYQIKKNDKILITVSRLGKEKNIEELIEIIKRIRGIDKCIKLLIVGDGPNKKQLEKIIKNYKLESSIFFVGMVDHKDIYKYYQLGDIFISASTSETQGLTYIEALANGLPLICKRDVCLNTIILDNQNGYQYFDIDEAVLKIIFLFQNESNISIMEEKSKTISNAFSKKIFTRKIVNLYKKIIIREKNNKYYNNECILLQNKKI